MAVFYKDIKTGNCYKCDITSENEKDIDIFLDTIGSKNSIIINEDEFNKKYDKVMTLDIYDYTDTHKIGELTTQWLDLDSIEEEIFTL